MRTGRTSGHPLGNDRTNCLTLPLLRHYGIAADMNKGTACNSLEEVLNPTASLFVQWLLSLFTFIPCVQLCELLIGFPAEQEVHKTDLVEG